LLRVEVILGREGNLHVRGALLLYHHLAGAIVAGINDELGP
jgi:hypothetical protein